MQVSTRLTIRYPAAPGAFAQELALAAGSLLQSSLEQSQADGLYCYRFDRNQALLELVSVRGLSASSIQPFQVRPG
jgi:hypothetical protein